MRNYLTINDISNDCNEIYYKNIDYYSVMADGASEDDFVL
jgi:hypothetical protein